MSPIKVKSAIDNFMIKIFNGTLPSTENSKVNLGFKPSIILIHNSLPIFTESINAGYSRDGRYWDGEYNVVTIQDDGFIFVSGARGRKFIAIGFNI